MAGALARLGVDRALVVSSEDGLDEMSTSAPTHVVEVNGDAIERYVVAPQDVGLELSAPTPWPAAPPTSTRRRRARSSPASPARERGLAAAQRGGRDLRRGRPTACARASRPPARRSTPGRRRAPPTPTSSCRGELAESDDRPRSHRRRHPRGRGAPPAGGPARRARAARRRQPRGPPLLRGPDAARASRSSPSTSAAPRAPARSAATRR